MKSNRFARDHTDCSIAQQGDTRRRTAGKTTLNHRISEDVQTPVFIFGEQLGDKVSWRVS